MQLIDFIESHKSKYLDFKIVENTLFVKKWNWDYNECLNFQKESQNFIQQNRKNKIFIFTNHPHVFTLGRGNERGVENLIDFDIDSFQNLAFPIHKIHRGGGITFHYPGQWIFYPIISISDKYTLANHTDWILKNVKSVLSNDLEIENVITANRLMGIWKDRSKLASIGVGVSKFVTEHGLALNLIYDSKMFDEVKTINPCGIDPTKYTTVDKFYKNENLLDYFHGKFIQHITNQ